MSARDVAVVGYDDLDRHLPAAGSIDRAAIPMGMYFAWCANHQLLSAATQDDAANLVLRVRFREATGSELAVAGCGGCLREEHLNSEGRAFTEAYYPRYMEDFRETFGGRIYDVRDDWDHNDRIARVLTRRLMEFGANRNVDGRGEQKWWKFWR